ncbi:MAG: alpha-ketoacid dehydrogenase subunit beta [Candidatus Micrarchaeota archaeon]|nr:alpha-ketoacid dehydrogenase subunit beta [Candidatus Micrarchaeota archaeon]MDE1848302.1 alpha-ketoacid dehydrogenase subunit beta [Candidatus Micrarchaeota archaeon]MDE1864755.1 alpha-ketoacid dehydrogenase subunit beta [Candidatus Micrarchaeota archaeon]
MKVNMVSAINSALNLTMQESEDVVLLGEDIARDGGVFRVTEGLLNKYGERRVIDTPLAESGILGAGIGMAMAGLHPVPEIQFAGFMFMGFGQLINHAARYRSRTRSTYKVPMVVRTPISGGVRTLEHHSDSPEAFYSHVGGLHVVVPSNPYDAKGMMIKSLHMQDPVVFLEPTKLYRLFKQEIPDEMYEVELGKANLVKEGTDLSIITYGTMVNQVTTVVEKRNLNADVLDLRTINPLDESAIIQSAKKTGKVLIVHEAPLGFGIGAEVAARIAEKAIFNLSAPIIRVGSDSFPYPFPGYENYYIPNTLKISKAIDRLLGA